MTTFAELKKNRKSNLAKLVEQQEKIKDGEVQKSYVDDRFWKPQVDKSGNGYAVIRFLPPSEGEDLPWARVFSHGFEGPTGLWYIENSLTTLGQKDPVGELNRKLWNSGIEANKEIARKQKRKLNYYSNIYVVSDPSNPENEGKVFLYRYGKKIFDKINEAISPEFEDETPINPFDMWEGANFKIKIRTVEGYINYDKSEFDNPSALLDDDEELEKIWKSQYSLAEFTDHKNFKSFDELQERLNSVLDVTTGTKRDVASNIEDDVSVDYTETKPKPAYVESDAPFSEDDDDDEDLARFRKMVEED